MVILSKRTVAAYKYKEVISEEEWTTSRKDLEFLDLDDRNETLTAYYNRLSRVLENHSQKNLWITSLDLPVDDCHLLRDWFSSESGSVSMFHHPSMKEPDWIGRNVFLAFVSQKISNEPRYLESGEAAVRFFHLARRCGYEKWKDYDGRLRDYVFSQVYPSVLTGLKDIEDQQTLMECNIWKAFFLNVENLCKLFERVPDAEHLGFLLDLARRSDFDVWQAGYSMIGFSYLGILLEYVRQQRFELGTILLNYGMRLQDDVTYWLKGVYVALCSSEIDFTPSREFTEMLEKLCVLHEVSPSMEIVRFLLQEEYEESYAFSEDPVKAMKGKAVFYELLDTCARFLE